jgi:hypothetical protein
VLWLSENCDPNREAFRFFSKLEIENSLIINNDLKLDLLTDMSLRPF